MKNTKPKAKAKPGKSRCGFAAMSLEKRTAIAVKGGLTVSKKKGHMAEIGSNGGNARWRKKPLKRKKA